MDGTHADGRPRPSQPGGRSRRAFLGTAAAAGTLAVAGCLGGTAPAVTLDHPAAADLESQPRLGPPIDASDSTIIVFEDPSCPTCRVFEERTMPRVRTELVDAGVTSVVAREYPIVAPWGVIGSRALEATFDRDAAAFWGLRASLYANQGPILSDVVYDYVRAFLVEETDLDADRVIRAVQRGAYNDAVQVDVDAATAAGVRGTPTLFLFRDGEYVTEIAGAPSFDLLVNALGV